jgi:Tfp pilus assembly protein PilF
LLLLASVGLAFSPLLASGFIDFDDDLYVTANPYVRAGLTWTGLKWAMQSTVASNWHPVTWLSHMLDCQLYGLQAWGHHLTSILLHGTNTIVLFLLLKRLTSALWPAFLVAALFGLHPLHVESVAWAAERKDVLSTLFFLLTLAAYAAYAMRRVRPRDAAKATRNPQPAKRTNARAEPSHALRFYFLSLGLFALGLMTKPMLVSLPLVLLLIDFWPLQRLQNERAGKLVAEKLPFVVLAVASSIVTYLVQKHSGALTEMASLLFATRFENALLAYIRYLGKTFWPADLTLFYPFPEHMNLAAVGLSALFLLTVTGVAVAWRGRFPWLLVGWGWFLITLGPVIGLVQAGGQAMADRYTYIPLIGIFVIIAWALHTAVSAAGASRPRPRLARALTWLPAPAVIGCAVLTFVQAGYWRNSETLWSHALVATRNNFLAYINLGLELERQKRYEEAAAQFRAAIQLKPLEAKAHANLANALCFQDRVNEGIAEYQEALRLNPNSAGVRHNLAYAFCRQGRFQDGIEQFEAALKLRPDSPQLHFDLATALAAAGRKTDAIAHLERALQLRPGYPEAARRLRQLKEAPQ